MSDRIPHSLVRALRDVPIFAEASEQTLLEIVGVSVNLLWEADETIFAVGDEAEALYVVLRGRVEITSPGDDETTRLAEVSDAGYFGEQALLSGTSHSKTVRALEDTELMVIPRDVFGALLEENPDLAQDVRERLAQRLERTRERQGQPGGSGVGDG